MSAAPKCYVCGSTEVVADYPPGGATCDGCLPARDHVVSNQTGEGGSALAVCPCGWRSEVSGKGRYQIQNVKVRLHWRDVIAQTIRAYEAEFGKGTALPMLVYGPPLAVAGLASVVLLAIGWGIA